MAHAGGRPSEYKPEYVEKVDEYLATRVDEQYQLLKTEGYKTTSWENKIKVKLPTLEDFAQVLGCTHKTLTEWEKVNPEFLLALDKIRNEQKKRLLDSGLSGDYNSTIAKLILSSNHGMTEKSEVDHTGIVNLVIEFLDSGNEHSTTGETKTDLPTETI